MLLEDLKDLAAIAEYQEAFINQKDWVTEVKIEDQVRTLASVM